MTEHWQVVELGTLCERVRKKNSDGHDRVLTVAARHGLVDQESYFNRRVAAKNLSGYSVIEKGTFVYNKSYSAAAPLGVIAASHHDLPGVVSPLYIVFRPVDPRVSPEFLELAVLSDTTLKTLRTFVKEGGRAHGAINISIGDFFSVPIPLPPLEEQRRIVDLVGSIDAYIDGLEGQIDATRTAREGVLSESLSNPGDDWQETTLGEISQEGLLTDGDWVESKDQDQRGGNRLLQLADVGDGVFLNKSDRWMNDEQFLRLNCTPVEVGDILIARMPDPIARACQVPEDLPRSCVAVDVAICRPPQAIANPKFLVMLINDWRFRSAAEARATGTTRKRVSRKNLAAIGFNLPSPVEQRRIVDLVGSFDEQISSLDSQVESARALRSGVLSELLSGERLLDDSYDMAVGL